MKFLYGPSSKNAVMLKKFDFWLSFGPEFVATAYWTISRPVLVAVTSGVSARRPTMVNLAKVLDWEAGVVENARRAEVRMGRERRRRKEDIFRCVACVVAVLVWILEGRWWETTDVGISKEWLMKWVRLKCRWRKQLKISSFTISRCPLARFRGFVTWLINESSTSLECAALSVVDTKSSLCQCKLYGLIETLVHQSKK